MESSGFAPRLASRVTANVAAMQAVLPRVCFVGRETTQWREIRRNIEYRHITVCDAENVDQVLDLYSPTSLDLIIVSEHGERLLPHEVCSDLRFRGYAGSVLVITGANDRVDPILALENGADAWIPTDVDPRTAVAQIRALLRRADKLPTVASLTHGISSLRVGDCVLCTLTRECSVGGQLIHLSSREFQLLWILASRADSVVSRDELARLLGHMDALPTTRSIDCYVARVRRRLGDLYGKQIKTIRAVGYMLTVKSLASPRPVASGA
jgi:two-component system, OmpR family, response regulator RstA